MLSSQINTSLIRPILETYSYSSAWNSWLKKDVDALERVQRRRVKLCTNALSFVPLSVRRYRADMRETYKLIHVNKDYKTHPEIFFELKHDNLRGFSKKNLQVTFSNRSADTVFLE